MSCSWLEKLTSLFQSVSGDMPPLTENNKFSNSDAILPEKFVIPVSEVEKSLSKVKPNKAAGPDRIEACMLRDLAPILAPPITAIYNSSLREGYIPPIWKSANVCPLPKKNPPKLIEKDIGPISLTPILAKELERLIIRWLRKETDHHLDLKQYGKRQNVSTTHMLVELIHNWSQAVDHGNHVRIVYLDYTKAFDKINHHILLRKYQQLDIHPLLLK